MLQSNQKRLYLKIKDGKIHEGENTYTTVRGYLKGIDMKEKEFKGEIAKYWYINIKSETGDYYCLTLSYSSGVAKSLFNSLANAPDFSKQIRIDTYVKGEFTNISTFLDDDKLYWKYNEFPPIEEVKVGNKVVKDDSKRMKVFEEIVQEINSKINA